MTGFSKTIIGDGRDRTAPSSAKIYAALSAMSGPPESFLTELLATQCRQAGADAAVLVRPGAAGRTEVLAAHPATVDPATLRQWLHRIEKAVAKVLQSGETVIAHHDPTAARNGGSHHYLIVLPIADRGRIRAAAAFRIKARNRTKLLLSRARLETTPHLLNHHE